MRYLVEIFVMGQWVADMASRLTRMDREAALNYITMMRKDSSVARYRMRPFR